MLSGEPGSFWFSLVLLIGGPIVVVGVCIAAAVAAVRRSRLGVAIVVLLPTPLLLAFSLFVLWVAAGIS